MTINCHCHIFDLECVPQEFRERFVLDMKNPIHKFVHWLLRRFLPPDCGTAQVLELAEKSILEIAQKLVQEMDETGCDICTPLMMDMGRFLWDEASYLKWFTEYSLNIFWCRVKFSDDEIKRLTEYNPKRFLGL